VVRREFRQFEGAWYDGAKHQASRDRVDRLGYFKEVTVDTAEVPGSPDQVDLTYTVTEQSHRQLSIGAGYSSADQRSASTARSSRTTFGSGNYLEVELNTSILAPSCWAAPIPTSPRTACRGRSTCTTRPPSPLNARAEVYEFAREGAASPSACRSPSSTRVFIGHRL
jgi:outer membrane protein insertion porin family